MRKILLSTLIVLSFFAFSAQAQSNYRLQNLANDLQRNMDDLANRAYTEFTNRRNNSRSDVDNLLTAQQLRASADIFRRMVYDNRTNSELRDASNALNDLSRRGSFGFSLGSEWRQVQRNIDDISREVGSNSGGWGNNNNNDNNDKDVVGRVRWQGKIDDNVHLIIRGSAVEVKTISGTSYNDGIFSFTSPLPNRNVDVNVDKKKGRGSVKVIQAPNRTNNFTAIIQILDKDGGARDYELDIYWTR